MPHFNTDVNVVLSFEGLGIRNFNNDTKNWEFLFLRSVDNHSLKLTIYNDQVDNSDWSKEKFEILIPKEHDIFIELPDAENVLEGNPSEYNNGDIDLYTRGIDYEDIRWTEDYLHGKPPGTAPVQLRNDLRKDDLSFLNIGGTCVLFTKVTNYFKTQNYEIWERQGGAKTLLEARRIGAKVGGAVKYPDGKSVQIRLVGKINQVIEIPIVTGVVTFIDFDNSCQGSPTSGTTSDFEHYYSDFFVDSDREIEIVPVNDSGKPGGRANCKVATPPPGQGGSLSKIGS